MFLVPDVHFYRCDVTDTRAVEQLCKEIKQTHGDASVLINNAGIGIGKTVLEVCHTLTSIPMRLETEDTRQAMPKARNSSK